MHAQQHIPPPGLLRLGRYADLVVQAERCDGQVWDNWLRGATSVKCILCFDSTHFFEEIQPTFLKRFNPVL